MYFRLEMIDHLQSQFTDVVGCERQTQLEQQALNQFLPARDRCTVEIDCCQLARSVVLYQHGQECGLAAATSADNKHGTTEVVNALASAVEAGFQCWEHDARVGCRNPRERPTRKLVVIGVHGSFSKFRRQWGVFCLSQVAVVLASGHQPEGFCDAVERVFNKRRSDMAIDECCKN